MLQGGEMTGFKERTSFVAFREKDLERENGRKP